MDHETLGLGLGLGLQLRWRGLRFPSAVVYSFFFADLLVCQFSGLFRLFANL